MTKRLSLATGAVLLGVSVSACQPNDSLTIENRSNRILVVHRQDVPSGPGWSHAFAGPSSKRYLLGPRDENGCSSFNLRAADLDGHEVSTTRKPCAGDTWVIASDGLTPSVAHVLPASRHPSDLQVRVIIPVSEYEDNLNWLNAVQETGATLDRRLRDENLGFSQGPYEEKWSITFYLYGPDQDRALQVAKQVLFKVPGPARAYARKAVEGHEQSVEGKVVDISPPRRPRNTSVPTSSAEPRP